MSDRIAVMNKGQLVGDRRGGGGLHEPQHDYTKALSVAVPIPGSAAMKRRKAARARTPRARRGQRTTARADGHLMRPSERLGG